MIQSMTGYGMYEAENERVRVRAEIRSLNHRYCEVHVRSFPSLLWLEEFVKPMVKEHIFRGKIDVSIHLQPLGHNERQVRIDWSIAEEYVASSSELATRFQLPGSLHIQDLMRLDGVCHVEEYSPNMEDCQQLCRNCVREAIVQVIQMRKVEGKALYDDFMHHIGVAEQIVHTIEKQTVGVIQNYRNRVKQRMADLLPANMEVDEHRLLQEVAVYADKAAVDEEVSRLFSHIDQCQTYLKEEAPVGRKLDFLMQEMLREANTIGAKASNATLGQLVVELKSCLEKMREQVQNIQ